MEPANAHHQTVVDKQHDAFFRRTLLPADGCILLPDRLQRTQPRAELVENIQGMNSITAYILGEVINFRCIAAIRQLRTGAIPGWLLSGVVKLCQLSDCIPYLTDHVQAEDIPEDLSGKIGSVSHLQNHSAKRNRIALFANRAPIHFGCFRRKKSRTAAFGSEKSGSGGKRALLFGKRSKYLLRKE